MEQLKLIVDQPVPGHFYWTLLDLDHARHEDSVVAYATGPLPTHGSAAAAGAAALAAERSTRRALTARSKASPPRHSEFGEWNVVTLPGALLA